MVMPKLSAEDRKKALEKAQQMRSKRAAAREELKAGNVSLADVLESQDEVYTKMKVAYLLESLPHIGKVTAAKLMAEIGIDENRRIQGLGSRQKAELLAKLG